MKNAVPLLATLLIGFISAASAATVTFGTPATESADSNISTTGMLVYAYNFTSDGTANATINGVTFAALNNGANANVFTDYSNSYNGFGSTSAPFVNLSAAYQLLLGSAYYSGGNNVITLQNLTVGHTYLFQYFVDDSRNLGGQRVQTLTSGSTSVFLTLDGSTGADGSLGQYVIATFKADGTSQSFSVSGTSQANGFELRDTTAVPEPGTYALIGLGVLGLFMARRYSQA